MPAGKQPTRGGDIRVGISGWSYPGWRGVFYPPGLPHARELAYAASRFRTIEINGTFYGTQRPTSFAAWAEATPDDFIFAVKGPRGITHMRKLHDVARPLANFLASGVLRLGAKLGPVLWQLPPNYGFHADRITEFLALLPRNTEAAAELARHHDAWLAGRAWTETDATRPLRHAIEVRHDSFRSAAFVALLRKNNVALVCADSVEWPRLMDVTADFVYCRLHGSRELYASGYGPAEIDQWAARVRAWARGDEPSDAERIGGPARKRRRDVFVYFDNDARVRAPADAAALAARVGQSRRAELSRPSRLPR